MPDYRGHAAELVHHDHGKNLASDDVVGRLLAEGFDGFRKKPKNCRAPVTILELLLAMRTNVRGGSSLFKKGLMELYVAGERDVANKAASVFISKSSGRSKRILQARLQSLQREYSKKEASKTNDVNSYSNDSCRWNIHNRKQRIFCRYA